MRLEKADVVLVILILYVFGSMAYVITDYWGRVDKCESACKGQDMHTTGHLQNSTDLTCLCFGDNNVGLIVMKK